MTDAAEEAKVTETTAIQVYQYFRDICSWRLLTHDSPLLLGGPGVVVQIDESLFNRTPKTRSLLFRPILFCRILVNLIGFFSMHAERFNDFDRKNIFTKNDR